MATFRLPNFNLTCNIWTCTVPNTPAIPAGPPRFAGVSCALVFGHRVNVAANGGTVIPGIPTSCISILFPARTDVRGPQDTVSLDMIECPAGSGRWYWVTAVDDIGKGYLNEHRTAVAFALRGSWTAPYP